jgi:acyl-CoA synthetase (AMP-forming)/AMP-acid ligase II
MVDVRVERLTAAAAEPRQRAAATALAGAGLGPGDRFAVVAQGSADLLCVVLGALRTGVVPVVLNPALLPHEQDALITDADVALVVRDDEVHALAAGDGTAELAQAPLGRPMHYTSGTTGTPKGVWSGVLDEDDALALLTEEQQLWGFAATDVHLCCAPLHHSAPIRFSAAVLLAGGDVVVVAPFDAAAVASAITEHRPTTAFVAPAHLQRLFAVDPAPPLDSFRLLAHAGAPCPEPLKRAALERFPDGSVWEFYGSTEGQFTACPAQDWLARPGTVGRARPNRQLRVDEDGLIWCRVPGYAAFEYWGDPAKTSDAWRPEPTPDDPRAGWFTVGDIGRLDDDGFLHLDGRRDDLIITGGVNVYPAEVERALFTLPGVEDAAVFGADDEHWGQRVCAAVVAPGLRVDQIEAHLAAQVAPYKRPKQIVLVDELPRTATGKVRRSTMASDLGLD